MQEAKENKRKPASKTMPFKSVSRDRRMEEVNIIRGLAQPRAGYYQPKYQSVHQKLIWALDYQKYHVKDLKDLLAPEIFIYGDKDGCEAEIDRFDRFQKYQDLERNQISNEKDQKFQYYATRNLCEP